MENTVKISGVEMINADCLYFITSLPDNSIDLIVTDPPYFKVKPNGWDHQWRGDADYLAWIDKCLAAFWRVLKPEGSIYLFCGHRLASDIEILMRNRFRILNHIIWAKPDGYFKKSNKERLRAYFPSTERILFAEHYQGRCNSKNRAQAVKCVELRQQVMMPLISYFQGARRALGVSEKQIADTTGKKNMVSHWFSASQWRLPGEADYRKLQTLFTRIAAEKHLSGVPYLDQPLKALKRIYLSLLEEYKSRRRYFAVSPSVPYTDVWTHKPVRFYPGKHPCEKPADMLAQIISASSRPGEIVADFFMGSGSTIKAAVRLGRRAIGVELETERFEKTVSEITMQVQKAQSGRLSVSAETYRTALSPVTFLRAVPQNNEKK